MKTMKVLISIIPLTLLLLSCGNGKKADEVPVIETKKGIILTNGTTVRLHPVLHSAKLNELYEGDTVMVVDISAVKSSIGNTRDYWYKIKNTDGVTGWVYGINLELVSGSDRDRRDIVKTIQQDELNSLKESLSGKWWSVDHRGEFTNHGLDIFEDGKYRSYTRGSANTIEGEFNFDVHNNEIVFLNNTSFQDDLNYKRRGRGYTLFRRTDTGELRFRQIQDTIDEEESPDTTPDRIEE